ncbi:MBL fold metallo-hydrolase [Chitinophaga sedimenti]|uniref:MBL fold metallo-hydrolase n=1 Tax=Chitinophaga sedimenti TaxID=2033606 RepID=UPI0020047BF0|nr:MBL fold metallo-hydrolase [Chitinophaga sedimenti]MCK7556275.1 MBL fold metallo-hydrolase [Chitinophaga sedimenti]
MAERIQLIDMRTYAKWRCIAPGVWGLRDKFVNVYFIHNKDTKKWMLVDAGLKTSTGKIRQAAETLFWPESAPACIVLTHGHFDHVGALPALLGAWNVPVFAHELEAPYLTGRSAYPPADPLAGGGLMTLMSGLYPNKPIDISGHLMTLADNDTIPGFPEWRCLHTPGHSPGHMSLYRESDGVLIAGDAFVTTKQESLMAIIQQRKEICGPPRYFTCDWQAAERSVKRLAALKPVVVATGHGKPVRGYLLRELQQLAGHFNEMAVPEHGRYSAEPAQADGNGVQYVPPRRKGVRALAAFAGLLLVVGVGVLLTKQLKR